MSIRALALGAPLLPTLARTLERTPALALTLAMTLAMMLSLTLAGCGGSDETPVNPPSPPTAADLTAEGWQHFEAGDLDLALAAFDSATVLNANHGPAYVGQGWTRLSLAATDGELQAAVGSFDTAFGQGETGNDTRAGRAAARLASAGSALASAIVDAEAVLADTPVYSFGYRSSFDHRDLHLIIAFAEVTLDDFAAALTAADAIQASGIDFDDSATWQVDSTTYLSFVAAVLAHVNKLAGLYAG